MPADLASLSYLAPLFAFVLVWVVVFAVLTKIQILGDSKFMNSFIAFIVASIFVTFAGVREFVLTLTPWVALLIVSSFFLLAILGFLGVKGWEKGIGAAVLVVFVLIFLISGMIVFSNVIGPYLPWGVAESGSEAFAIRDWLYSARVVGAMLLIIVSAVVSWILIKVK